MPLARQISNLGQDHNHMSKFAFFVFAQLFPFLAIAAPGVEVTIPLENEPTGHVSATLSLNGLPARLLVDTGANMSTLDKELGQRFRVSYVVEPNAPKGTPAHVDLSVSLNDSVIRVEEFAVLDLSFINVGTVRRGASPFDGQLGATFFRALNATIDFENMEIRLRLSDKGKGDLSE